MARKGGRARAASQPTKAMLLAAGQGTRLMPLTDQTPKCMVRVGGRPLLEYTITWLRRNGVREVVINLHPLPAAGRSTLAGTSSPPCWRRGGRCTATGWRRTRGSGGSIGRRTSPGWRATGTRSVRACLRRVGWVTRRAGAPRTVATDTGRVLLQKTLYSA